ncbi:protein kinase [Corallococcus sp. BB11-1]|uniref:serine/threonine protein kinase n=1 Tax=Corallococcus sp. BB11-1 TaxID=2996783 RepID=UPI00226DECB4|nr:serine/threonine-protein kinase [Corallococcus sp. BB11-1]MCY1032227.1 protein kinase [Corallococcus sp. BB11-1]
MNEPQAFGRYELLERLGAGGMAMVYRGKYTAGPGITKAVVIKRVLSQYSEDPAFVEMFLNEARISVGLNHGNIVQVFDFGQVDGEYFLAMEFVDGQPLSRVMKRLKGREFPWMPAPLAVSTVIELCRGLHHAHTRTDEQGVPLGLVHRDISPDNVLVSYEGEVKVADFGIAKARLAGRPQTEVGVIKGKYPYLAPEQLKQWPADARADVYAVGVVLFELLCGERPVTGNELEIFQRATEGRLTPARSLNPSLDDDLLDILKRALAPMPGDRYQSAEALQQSLSDWLGAHASRLPTHARKLFMTWAFQEELVAQHRPVPLPDSFVRQLQAWRHARILVGPSGTGTTDSPPSPAMHEWPVLPEEFVPKSLPRRLPEPPAPVEEPAPEHPRPPSRLRTRLSSDAFWLQVMAVGIGVIFGVFILVKILRLPRSQTPTSHHLPPSNSPVPDYERGRDLLAQGHPEAAVRSFQTCLRKSRNDGDCLLGLAKSYEALGQWEAARVQYQRFMDGHPLRPEVITAHDFLEAHPP